ncbi:MAG: phosphoribosylanthranilate isomerase [Acidobacteriota bacterium]
MTLVKICGITNLEDARHVMDCGADQLGFNFYEKSSRHISSQDARRIVDALPVSSANIGVFVNKDIEEVLEIVKFVGLEGIQLHGDEDEFYISNLTKQTNKFIVKAFRVSSRSAIDDATESNAHYVLLDGHSPTEQGGTGKTFNWDIAYDAAFLRPESVYLAGGLNPENVAQAIRKIMPYAVDVASGVESSKGKKDPDKIAAFIKAAKEAL